MTNNIFSKTFSFFLFSWLVFIQINIISAQPMAIELSCADIMGTPTNVGSVIPGNITWTQQNSPYIINSDVRVLSAATLTVNPCVEVVFMGDYELRIEGGLEVQGAAGMEAAFTSGQTVKSSGDWKGIHFSASSQGNINFAQIEYADRGIYISDSSPNVTESKFLFNVNGIYVTRASLPVISESTFSNNSSHPIIIDHTSAGPVSAQLSNNSYMNVPSNGIKIMATGTNSIYHDTKLSKDNTFYEVSDYLIIRHAAANLTGVMTIDPGVEIRFANQAGFIFGGGPTKGALHAVGTPSDPIKLTSLAQPRVPGSWRGLHFPITADGTKSKLDHVIVEYAGQNSAPAINIDFANGSFDITNSIIRNNGGVGIHIKSKFPITFTNNTLDNNKGVNPLVVEHSAQGSNSPILRNNQYTNHISNGIKITTEQNTRSIYHDTTLTKDNTFYEVNDYLFIRHAAVNQTGTMTIEPGVEVRFAFNAGLNLEGGPTKGAINATGTQANPIKFTSIAQPSTPGSWRGIRLTSTTNGSLTNFDHVIIEGAGNSGHTALIIDGVKEHFSVTNSTIQNNGDNAVQISNHNPSFTSAPTFLNNTITNHRIGMLIVGNTKPRIEGNTISNSSLNPAVIDHTSIGSSSPIFKNNTYSNNVVAGIRIMATGPKSIYYDTTLTKDNTYYEVHENLIIRHAAVNQTGTMTIEPGVEVRFGNQAGFNLEGGPTKGAINATGTQTAPIKFTSIVQPGSPGSWKGIRLTPTTNGSLTNFDYITIENAGQGSVAALDVNGVDDMFSVTNSIFQKNLDNGLKIGNSEVHVTGNVFLNNKSGLFLEGKFIGNVNDNTISNSALHPIILRNTNGGRMLPNLNSNTYVNNNPNRIFITTQVGSIYRDTRLTKDSIDFEILEKLIVQYGVTGEQTTVTVDPGVKLLFGPGAELQVGGSIHARGTQAEPIMFTSNQQNKNPGDWMGLKFLDYSSGSLTVLDHVQIEYAGQGLNPAVDILGVPQPLTIQNTVVNNNLAEGIRILNSSPKIEKSTISNNTNGLSIESNSSPNLTDNTITMNRTNGIYLKGNPGTYPNALIRGNAIENNTNFDFYADEGSASVTVKVEDNWWGTTNSANISNKIFDNADNSARPVVDFSPFLHNSISSNPISSVSLTQKVFDPKNAQTTSIKYELGVNAHVTINIFDFKTKNIVRTLLNGVAQIAGSKSIIFDGKDNSNQVIDDGLYYYQIEARDASAQLLGLYAPGYAPIIFEPINTSMTPILIDPYKGEEAKINYELSQAAFVKVEIGTPKQLSSSQLVRTLFSNKLRAPGVHEETWNGRNDNNLFANPEDHMAVIYPQSLPENGIIVQTMTSLSIESIKADPFIFRPSYSDVAKIEYIILGESAFVTVEIEDTNGSSIVQLINNELKSVGTHEVLWDGTNATNKVVSAGNYLIKTRAVGSVSGKVVEKVGSITIFE